MVNVLSTYSKLRDFHTLVQQVWLIFPNLILTVGEGKVEKMFKEMNEYIEFDEIFVLCVACKPEIFGRGFFSECVWVLFFLLRRFNTLW